MNQDNTIRHIAIAGNIGAGKTTLCEQLARQFNWEVHYESTDDNPYLSDFYTDMARWSFNLQVYFLHSRYAQVLQIQNGKQTIIQDRTIYEDAFIFAPNLHEMGLMTQRDFENYFALFKTMTSQIDPPDLLIYLRASVPTLVNHIAERGRDYEGSISLDYLKNLNQRYETWISGYDIGKLLIIDVDDLDFVKRPDDLSGVIDLVQRELFGLF